MRRFIFTCMMLGLGLSSFSQALTGVKTVGTGGDYATLELAISALNASGVGAGGVTFNIAAGHTESIITTLTITATGTSANPIVFQKSGAGLNPLITRTDGGSLTTSTFGGHGDAVIQISGGDYITFDGIDVAAGNQGIEYGYYTFKPSATDGCQYVTIKNASITLTKGTSGFVTGIYISNGPTTVSSAVGVTVSANSGRNENIVVTGNAISNVHSGIHVRGGSSTLYYDQNVIIGATGSANTITNFGGGSATTTYGIYTIYQDNQVIDNNSISNNTNHTAILYGIMLSSSTNGSFEIKNNNVSLRTSTTTSQVYAIYNSAGGTASTCVGKIFNNVVSGLVTTAITSATFGGIYNATAVYNMSIYNNSVINNDYGDGTTTATGTFYGIWASGSTSLAGSQYNIYGNTVTGNQRQQSILGSGTFYPLYVSGYGATTNIYNNSVYNNTMPSTTGTTYLLYATGTSGITKNIYGNQLYNHTGLGGTSWAIYNLNGDANIYRNNIYNIEALSTSAITGGIYSSGVNKKIYNNFISDLRNNNSTSATAIHGIQIAGGTNVGIYYNSIYLHAVSSSTTTFGTNGVYVSSTTPVIDMRNNIIVNHSSPGPTGGNTTAFRYASSTLTNIGNATNYNCLHAGTPAANQLIFWDGTNTDQTIATYKARLTPRESASFTEVPPFVNIATAPFNLHLAAGTPTQCESGGQSIAGITDDFDGHTRFGETGYTGAGSGPDIGADEGNFTGLDLIAPTVVYTPFGNTGYTTARTLTTSITDASGVPTAGLGLPVLYWAVNAGAYTGVTATYVSGDEYTFTFGGGVSVGDSISYYIVAQDNATTPNIGATPGTGAAGFTANPPAASTHPSNPGNYKIIPSLVGTFHIGTGVGADYATLTAAVADYNVKFVTGAVNFVLHDATYPTETFPIVIGKNLGASATNVLTIKPNTATTVSISGSSSTSIIRLDGAVYVVIDGSNNATTSRDLTIENTSTSASTAVVWFSSAGIGQGVKNSVLKNCIIKAGTNTTSSRGVNISGTSITVGGNDHSDITIENNSIQKAQYGIYGNGNSLAYITQNLQIKNNTIGSATATDYVTGWGIWLSYVNNSLIEGNDVFNMIYDGSKYGIYFATTVNNTMVSKNKIYGLAQTNTTTTYYANGMYISSGSTDITIQNNMIYDINTYGSTSIFYRVGIRILGGTNIKVYHNSIHLSGTYGSASANLQSAALYPSSAVTNLDVRNNVFSNITSGTTPVNHAVYSVNSHTNPLFDYNVYYTTGSVIGYWGTNVSNLDAWKTLTGQDANTFNVDPQFTSNTNLHINSGTNPSFLESTATPIAGITSDIDGDVRPGPVGSLNGGGTAPDRGADEFDGVPPTPVTYVSSTVTQKTGMVFPNTTNNHVIGIEIVATGQYPPISATSFTLNTTGTTAPLTDISNAKIWFTGTNPAFATTSQFGATVAAPSGTFSITGNQALASGTSYFWLSYDIPVAAVNANLVDAECTSITLSSGTVTPTVSAPAGSRNLVSSISGVKTVGTGGDFATLHEAFTGINAVGLSGNTTLNIISNITETQMPSLNEWSETPAASNYTLLIQPQGGQWTVSGSLTAIIKLNGADRVTIDGLNTGGNGLTISNTSTTANSAGVWLSSLGSGLGATSNIVQNCTITTGSTTATTYGVAVSGTSITTTGADNDNVTVQNNVINNAAYGIYANGTSSLSSGGLDNLSLINNAISFAGTVTGIGIRVGNALNAQVNRNVVDFQTSASSQPVGISLETGVNTSVVNANLIKKVLTTATSGYGGRGITVGTGLASSSITISNNMIYGINGSNYSSFGNSSSMGIGIGIIGISSTLTTITGGINLYYNTVNMTGNYAYSSACITAALYVGSATSALDIRNNIFMNQLVNTSNATSKAYSVYSAVANTAYTTINYNDYYVGTTQGVLCFLSSDRATLLDWQTATAQDVNSINVVPDFISATDLHMKLEETNLAFDGTATPIAGITTDFDGDTRNVTTPDIGADEFTIPPCTGAVGGTIAVANPNICVSGTKTFTASGYSVGLGSGYQWQMSTDNFSLDIQDIVGATDPTGYTSGTITANTWYRLKVTCTSGAALNYSNVIAISVHALPTADVTPATPAAVCQPDTVTLTVTTNAANPSYIWKKGGVDITGATASTYSATVSGAYTVEVTDGVTACVNLSAAVNVTVNLIPTAVVVTPASSDVCIGGVQQLTASGGLLAAAPIAIGDGTIQNTSSSYPTPYGAYYETSKNQLLVLASELIAQGLTAGKQLNSIAFNVTALNGSGEHVSYTIRLAQTTVSVLTATFETPVFTTVFGPVSYYPVLGSNVHNFIAPITWDGTSNILVDICFSNDPGGTIPVGYTNNASVSSTIVPFTSAAYSFTDNQDHCATPPAASTSAVRPNMVFGVAPESNAITWSPIAGLFTDASATIPYTGTGVSSVYAKPAVGNHTYTATATTVNSCTNSGSAIVDVHSLPTATTTTTAVTICYGDSVELAVDLTGTANWSLNVTDGVTPLTIPGITASPWKMWVKPTATTTYQVTGVTDANCTNTSTAQTIVTVRPQFVLGSISANQTICYNTAPAQLVGVAPTGGDGTYTYQWESSTDNVSFNLISGANALNYTSGALMQTTYFKLKQINLCDSGYTNTITITVRPEFIVGSISSAQTICKAATPLQLTGVAPTGGDGVYSYQWEESTNNVNFSDITGADALNYSPAALNVTTYYRLKQISGSGCGTVTTNTVTITVHPGFSMGSITGNQAICYNTVPAQLAGTAPTGGDGVNNYQWLSSTDDILYAPINLATNLNFSPAALTLTTYYKLVQSNGCGLDTTNKVTITVIDTLVEGTISATQTLCAGVAPASLTSQPAIGGTGTYNYLWQRSLDGGLSWQDITGQNTLNFQPPVLTATRHYRMSVSSGICGPVFSNEVAININDLPSVSVPANVSIVYGTDTVIRSVVTGGTAPYTYAWSPVDSIIGASNLDSIVTKQLYGQTVFTLLVTDASSTACQASAQTTVNMLGGPVSVSASANPTTVCAGKTVDLTANGSGGTGNFTFTWSSTPAGFSANGASVSANPTVTTTYTVEIYDGYNTNTSTVTVNVNPLPIVNFSGLDSSYCINATAVTLNGSPIGGTFYGNGISGNGFNPATAGLGSHEIKYIYSDINSCVDSVSYTTTVKALPVVGITALNAVCIDGAAITLSNGTPAGGTYSGNGVAAGVFTPATAGAGSHFIKYSFTDGNTCTNSDSTAITVNALPVISMTSLAAKCVDAAAFTLNNASPTGGTYSGNGVTAGVFTPATAGAGSHYIKYTFIDGNTCTNSDSVAITVNALPVITMTALAAKCVDAVAFTLNNATPSGGTYSGNGVTAGVFTPASASVGSHYIKYTYTDGNTCTNSDSVSITVNALPVITMTALAAKCVDAVAFTLNNATPSGGVYSGSGVAAGMFAPAIAGVGSHYIKYTYTDGNTCTNADSVQITVNALPVITMTSLAANCFDAAAFALNNATPTGGTYSGSGVAAGMFTPATAGVGSHYIKYTYIDGNTCTKADSVQVTVNPSPVVTMGSITSPLCLDASPIALVGTPAPTLSTLVCTTNCAIPSACSAASGNANYEHITSVSLNGATQNSVGSTYTNYTSTVFTQLFVDSTYTLSGTILSDGSENLTAFIDWNRNGSADAGESVILLTNAPSGAVVPFSTQFTVPSSAVLGDVRMRMVLTYSAIPAYCGTFSYGEVEDYKLNVAAKGSDGVFSGTGVTGFSFTPAVAGAGTHTVIYTYTNSFGCSSSDSAQVTVLALPTSTATAAGATTFCDGGSVVINANTGTGIDHQWRKDGTAITGATSVGYTATTTGVYTVVVTNTTTSCSNVSPGVTVTVNPLPIATATAATATTFCDGDSVVINANTGAGISYQWSKDGAAISTATASSYTATTGGNYRVIVTNTATMCVDSSTAVVVTVNPLPIATATAAGATTFCDGETVIINANTGTGLAWQWKNNNTDIAGATASSLTAGASGSYTVVVTDTATSCSNASSAVVVTVNPLPIATATAATATTFCDGDSVVISTQLQTGVSYQWTKDGLAITGATTNDHAAYTTGIYKVIVTNTTTLCVDSSMGIAVTAHALPVVSLGTLSGVCLDAPAYALSGGTPANGIYSGTGVTAGLFDPSAAGVGIFTITYTYTDTNSCVNSAQDSIEVYALPIADAGSDIAICLGSSTTLTATGGIAYLWSNADTTAATIVSPTATTMYYVTVSDANCSAIDSVEVTVNYIVYNNLSDTVALTSQIIVDAGAGYYSYLWSTGATSRFALIDTAGVGMGIKMAWCEVTDINGCAGRDTMNVDFTTIGVGQVASTQQMKVYPNPSSDIFNVAMSGFENSSVNACVLNLQGQVIWCEEWKLVQGAAIRQIDMGTLPRGVYFLRLGSDKLQIVERIIVK